MTNQKDSERGTASAVPTPQRVIKNGHMSRQILGYLKRNLGLDVPIAELAKELDFPEPNISASISYMRSKGIQIDKPLAGVYRYRGDRDLDVRKVLPGHGGQVTAEPTPAPRPAPTRPVPSPPPLSSPSRPALAHPTQLVLPTTSAPRPTAQQANHAAPRTDPALVAAAAAAGPTIGDVYEVIGFMADDCPLVKDYQGRVFRLVAL